MSRFTDFICHMICIYIFILPIVPSKFKFKGIPLNGDAILALIIILYLINILISSESRKRFKKGIKDFFTNYNTIFMFLWIAMMFISVLYSTDIKLALKESIRISTYMILFFIIKYDMHKKYMLYKIIYSSIFVSIIIGVIGIYEYAKGIGLQHTGSMETVNRVASTLENSNNLGAFFVLLAFPYIVLFLREKNKRRKILFGIATIISILNVIFSFSRNAWLGLIVGYVALIFVFNFKLIYGAILGGGIALSIPKIINRLKEVGDTSQNLSRVSLWKVAIEMIRDHPILGVGNGNYRTLYSKYYKDVEKLGYKAHENFHPHNAYLKAQCELGVMGSVSLVGFLVSTLIKNNKFSNKVKNQFYKYFYKGYTASIVAFIFMSLIDNFFSAPKVIAFFWIFIAVSNSYEYNVNNEQNIN